MKSDYHSALEENEFLTEVKMCLQRKYNASAVCAVEIEREIVRTLNLGMLSGNPLFDLHSVL
jgi:hypothetical protein